jgi:hypothetical protein
MSVCQRRPIRLRAMGGRRYVMPEFEVKKGQTFKSISDAARKTGINRTEISAQLAGRIPAARGCVFERI